MGLVIRIHSLCSLDYGEDLVVRFRASGLTRREFAERAGVPVSTLDYYVRRERKASPPGALPVNRILPVDLIAAEAAVAEASMMVPAGGISIWISRNRRIEVRRGFDAQLLREVLAVLGIRSSNPILEGRLENW